MFLRWLKGGAGVKIASCGVKFIDAKNESTWAFLSAGIDVEHEGKRYHLVLKAVSNQIPKIKSESLIQSGLDFFHSLDIELPWEVNNGLCHTT